MWMWEKMVVDIYGTDEDIYNKCSKRGKEYFLNTNKRRIWSCEIKWQNYTK
jgi:hypothetical protein